MKRVYSAAAGVAAIAALSLALAPAAFAQSSNARGKISRNVYRIPYVNGASVRMNQDYVDHGNTPAGDFGSMDMVYQSNQTPFILAAAAGQVIQVSDGLNGCGCHSAYGPCANVVRIRHANGEVSTYLHLQQNSATNAGIVNNLLVTQGQTIGIEGDVGWTCGNTSNPRTSSCVPVVPPNTGNCGRHLHWNVVRESTGERVNPYTCGISGNIYTDNATYTTANCSSSGCSTNLAVGPTTYSGFGTFRVLQATNQISVSNTTVQSNAGVVYHAGNSVRMLPGFRAANSGYFRAEIGTCNTTAPAPSL